jgi:hypothetical protein
MGLVQQDGSVQNRIVRVADTSHNGEPSAFLLERNALGRMCWR